MKSRTLIGAAMMAMLLAPAAYAASTVPSQECTALETQFDRHIARAEVSDHHNGLMSPVMTARTLRLQGAKLCRRGESAAGIEDLQHALRDIGLTPAI
jgi:hypothetical protein